MMTSTVRLFVCLLAAALIAIWAAPAQAQGVDPGLRAGLSVDPDQFYFGGHLETGPVFEQFRFRPNVEVGFGDHVNVVGLNGEMIYPFQLDNGTHLFAGAGPAINIISFDFQGLSDTTVEPGLNFLFGFEFEKNYFAEIKVGAFDSPEVKFGFGYTWRND